MTWCNTPGASNLANLGIPCNFSCLRLIVKHFLHERPPLRPPLLFLLKNSYFFIGEVFIRLICPLMGDPDPY